MSGDLDLEQRYRRVLRLLPGYYRDMWEEDMVAAFLVSVPALAAELTGHRAWVPDTPGLCCILVTSSAWPTCRGPGPAGPVRACGR